MSFVDRVAMVTGGAGALGRDVVSQLIKAGARVAVPYRRKGIVEIIEAAPGEVRSRLYASELDLTAGEAVQKFTEGVVGRWGRIDFLFAVAGGFAAGRSFETEEAIWEQMLETNLHSLVTVLRAVVPVMIRQKFGRIVTVSDRKSTRLNSSH